MPDISKLPKWAQDHIDKLTGRAERAEEQCDDLVRQIEEYEGRQGERIIELEPYRNLFSSDGKGRSRSQLFPISDTVRFSKQKDGGHSDRHAVEIRATKQGWLQVSAVSGNSLEVRPRSGNLIAIRAVEHEPTD